jgi:beta-ureidopropionase
MPRHVVVATASLRSGGAQRTIEENLTAAERLLEQAAAAAPDIVCLPETFPYTDVPYRSAFEVAEPLGGPITERIGAVARRHSMYVVCPMLERAGDHCYNTAVLLDRQGAIVGAYRKIHPTVGEIEQGISAGKRVAVFSTDFGRVGVLICFDLMFPARWQEAKQQGAELMFWPSAYEGGLPLVARACDHQYYVVSATPVWHSRILDITGHELASTGQRVAIAWAQIDLEKRLFSTDYNMARYHAILARYGRRITINVLSPEGVFTLECHDPALSVAAVVQEFGLEPLDDYVRRSAAWQEQVRRPAGAADPALTEAAG